MPFQDIPTFFKETTPVVAVLIVAAYFLKVYLEKRLEGLAGRAEEIAKTSREMLASRLEEIAKTSLAVKKDLRGEERGELVAFRVAIEEWENFLQTILFDFSMLPGNEARIEPVYQKDKELFLKVKIAVVKVGIYLRDQQLEQRLMTTVIKLRSSYYPLISDAMPRLIDLQARLAPLDLKLAAFAKSNLTDMTYAPTEKDREEHATLQGQMTEEMRRFSEGLLKEYRGIAEQLADLKGAINQYIYRPIQRTDIDQD